jgi:Ca-activated chloride channel homolog
LLDRPQQLKAIELGFRRADPSVPLTAPLDAQHGVDINQPQTILEIPSADVIKGIQSLWLQVKKPVDLVVVMDTSGSMQGSKISSARDSLVKFLNILDARDRISILTFNSKLITMSQLSPLGEKRDDLVRRVSGIVEGGGTRLHGATYQAYQDLSVNGDPKHIRAIVVLSAGMDTDSVKTLDEILTKIGSTSEEGGNAIKLFTIAFGSDADQDTLKQLADATGGMEYQSDPATIQQIYEQIATFF